MLKLPIRWACLIISVASVSVSAIMFALKVKETKGVNLDRITEKALARAEKYAGSIAFLEE